MRFKKAASWLKPFSAEIATNRSSAPSAKVSLSCDR